MKIFIAAGHGGKDPGAVANGTTEAKETISIVDAAFEILKKRESDTHKFVKIDSNLALLETVNFINDQTTDRDRDIAIEVHLNANSGVPGTGIEVYYGSLALASKLNPVLVEKTGLAARGIKEGNYLYFNNATIPQTALVELGFITNPQDIRIVRERGAGALASAVIAYLGLPELSVEAPPSNFLNLSFRISNFKEKLINFIKNLEF